MSNSFEGDIRDESVFTIRLYYSLQRWNLLAQQAVLGTFLLVFTLPSGRGLLIPIFFIIFLFFLDHLPQTPGFRSARQILAVFFATQARNCILSDLNTFYTSRGGRTTAESNAPGAFLVILVFLLYLGNTNQNSINWRCESLQFDKVLAFVYECDNFAFVNYWKLMCSCLCKWLLCRCLRSHFRLAWL